MSRPVPQAPALAFRQRRTLRAATLTLAALAAFAAPAQEATPASEVQLQSRVFEIARKLRCPVCVSESVGDSNASISIEMRNQIQSQLEDGRSEAEILAFFQERYGDWILLEPPRRGVHLLAWWLPRIALAAGVGGLAWLMLRWTRASRRAAVEDAPDDADLARVRAALQGEEERP